MKLQIRISQKEAERFWKQFGKADTRLSPEQWILREMVEKVSYARSKHAQWAVRDTIRAAALFVENEPFSKFVRRSVPSQIEQALADVEA